MQIFDIWNKYLYCPLFAQVMLLHTYVPRDKIAVVAMFRFKDINSRYSVQNSVQHAIFFFLFFFLKKKKALEQHVEESPMSTGLHQRLGVDSVKLQRIIDSLSSYGHPNFSEKSHSSASVLSFHGIQS
jgi:hypothetical protein